MSLSKGLMAIAIDLIGPIPDFRYRNTVPILRNGETYCVAPPDISDRNQRRLAMKDKKKRS